MKYHNQSAHNITLLKTQLISQLLRLIEYLFAGRKIVHMAHEYRIGSQGSISICRANGRYFDYQERKGGDIFKLIEHVLKTDFKGALLWANNFIGYNPKSLSNIVGIKPSGNVAERQSRQRYKALAMIKRAKPIEGTLAKKYLRVHRGILFEQLPSSLGFIEHVYNYTAGSYHPAMIAAICNVDAQIIAAQCTFLDTATGDKLKGDGIKSRLIFGSCRGGAIRLQNATGKLALCEGIEDALSIMQSSTDWPIWATGGTSGLLSVQVPPNVHEVMICADRDEAGMNAARKLSSRLIKEGKKVRIAMPPMGVKDFNDLLRHGGSHV